MPPRKRSARYFEGDLALISIAGIRQLTQGSVAPTASGFANYTIANEETRRAVCVHIGTDNDDIHFNYKPGDVGSDAAATDVPIIPARYFVVDCEKGDVLSFFNTSGGTITVYIIEVE